jgi:capsular polysaccharide transport system permease protein
VIEVIYEPVRGIIGLNVRAFEPEFAHAVAAQVLEEAGRTLNDMVDVAQQDATRFTRVELEAAEGRLRDAREAFTRFRSQARIVDPESDLAGQMALVQTMQAELASLLIERDMLVPLVEGTDPRIPQIDRQIAAVRARIEDERSRFGRGGEARSGGTDYATLLEEFERLDLERSFAEEAYASARAAHDAALAEALRQNRYIAAHVQPGVPELAMFPGVLSLLAQLSLLLLTGWIMVVLIYYSVRDSR